MKKSVETTPPSSGGRDARMRATRERIAEAAFTLFMQNGFDETTVDDIAAAADISRRSFFSYFKTKDDVVVEWQTRSWERTLSELRTTSPDVPPLLAVRNVLMRQAESFDRRDMKRIDDMMLASDTLRARKPAVYAVQEELLYQTLCEVYRQPQRRATLRLVAMMSIGAMRVAIETWRAEQWTRPAAEVLVSVFEALPTAV